MQLKLSVLASKQDLTISKPLMLLKLLWSPNDLYPSDCIEFYFNCLLFFFYFNRADFPILSEHGIMPVTDVNENFSSPINGDNERGGFNGEPIQQPSTPINTVIIFFNIL